MTSNLQSPSTPPRVKRRTAVNAQNNNWVAGAVRILKRDAPTTIPRESGQVEREFNRQVDVLHHRVEEFIQSLKWHMIDTQASLSSVFKRVEGVEQLRNAKVNNDADLLKNQQT